MKSAMMFAVHGGSKLGCQGVVGVLMSGHALPLAFRETPDCTAEEVGFKALWECFADVEEVFNTMLRLDYCPKGPGIYIVEVDFDIDDVDQSGYEDTVHWEHLADCHPHKVADADLLQAANHTGDWVWC